MLERFQLIHQEKMSMSCEVVVDCPSFVTTGRRKTSFRSCIVLCCCVCSTLARGRLYEQLIPPSTFHEWHTHTLIPYAEDDLDLIIQMG